jgi:hypothetical protein
MSLPDITWPESLPSAPLLEPYREKPPETALRTQMDQGPAKLRQRTTAGVGEIEVAYLLTAAQTAALESFYCDTLAGGSLAFVFNHPRRAVDVAARFKKPPQIASGNGRYFEVRLELEILP